MTEPVTDSRVPQEDIDAAADQIEHAFALLGLVSGGNLVCPACGTAKKNKVVIKTDKKYWKCYRCGEWSGAIALMQNHASVGFTDAVNLLLGRVPSKKPKVDTAAVSKAVISTSFQASEDPWVWNLYRSVLESDAVSLAKAQQYYAAWHISPEIVAEQRSGFIVDAKRLHSQLKSEFGEDKMISSGIAVETEHGVRLLCGWNYPVIEPAIDHQGFVRNMQFRPSMKQREKLIAHKTGQGPYVPAFMSIKGSGPKHLIGCGLQRIGTLDRPSSIYVVEGFKDLMAARTMGAEAYAMPGTGIYPPPGLVGWLAERGHKMLIALDGDEAGNKARPLVKAHFVSHGFDEDMIETKDDMPDGMDVTDILVARHLRDGCNCSQST